MQHGEIIGQSVGNLGEGHVCCLPLTAKIIFFYFNRPRFLLFQHLLLDEGVSPQNTMAGEKLQTNGHYQPRCSHQGLSTDINSSFEANQSLPEVSSKKLYSKSKPVPSKLNHSLNIGELLHLAFDYF